MNHSISWRYPQTAALAAAVFASQAASAHDFWLQPETYWAQPAAALPLTLQVGDESSRQRSQIQSSRITRFASLSPAGETLDRRGDLQLHGPEHDGELRLGTSGTHVVFLETDNSAESHLPADRFNAYLEDEGLTVALEQRRRAGQTLAEGSERYSRRAKTLVQVGSAASPQTAVSTPVGLSLEIVPEVNPYAQPQPRQLPLRVLYRGAPLAGALVRLIDLRQRLTRVDEQRSDAAGSVRFDMPNSGAWLAAVTWTEPLPDTETVDFETTFSTLSFGFPATPLVAPPIGQQHATDQVER